MEWKQLIAHLFCTNTFALSGVAFTNLHLLSLLSVKIFVTLFLNLTVIKEAEYFDVFDFGDKMFQNIIISPFSMSSFQLCFLSSKTLFDEEHELLFAFILEFDLLQQSSELVRPVVSQGECIASFTCKKKYYKYLSCISIIMAMGTLILYT